MPRRFSLAEEERIRAGLRAAGRESMGRRGVRKTGIDELAAAANISKGSFYRFFSSKEELALELLAEWERGFHDGIEQRFRAAAPQGVQECAGQLAAALLEDFPQQMTASGLQGLFDPQEISYLKQRAQPEQVRLMDEQDIRLFNRIKPLFSKAGLVPREDEMIIIAGLRLLFEAGNGVLAESAKGAAPGPASSSTMSSTEQTALTPAHYRLSFIRLLEGFIEKMFLRINSED